jgi:hypothetical protein
MMLCKWRVSAPATVTNCRSLKIGAVTLTDPHARFDCGLSPLGQRGVRSTICADRREASADRTGRSFPLGTHVVAAGVNFDAFSRQASRVDFLLFNDAAAVHLTRSDRVRSSHAPCLPSLARFRARNRSRTGCRCGPSDARNAIPRGASFRDGAVCANPWPLRARHRTETQANIRKHNASSSQIRSTGL